MLPVETWSVTSLDVSCHNDLWLTYVKGKIIMIKVVIAIVFNTALVALMLSAYRLITVKDQIKLN